MLTSISFDITTDSSGDYTDSVYITERTGQEAVLLYAVDWQDGTLADGVDATLAMANDGVSTTILTLTDANNDAWYFPRELEDDNAGSAVTTYCKRLVTGTLTLTVASGGNVASGKCVVYVQTCCDED